jgi:deoxycytidine triphosphate deaminase
MGGIKSDRWIREQALRHGMIDPFVDKQVREGVISYGVSSYGYDLRVADEYKIFTNVHSAIVDPKAFDPRSFVDFKGPVCVIPPNSFALARTYERLKIPRNVICVCVGKCVTGDTRVVDAETGDWLPIEQFVSSRRGATEALQGWRLGASGVASHLDNGEQPVYRVTTRAGIEIRATATHPFRTFGGWTALANLRPGSRIAVARTCGVFGREDLPEHEASLLGFLLADAQCPRSPGSSPRYTTSDRRLVEAFTEVARGSGCEVSPVGRYGYDGARRGGRGGAPIPERAAMRLYDLACDERSGEKFVPAVIFRAKKESVAAFLRALFTGEGSACLSEEGIALEFDGISRRLATEVRHLLLRFGVFALLRRKEDRGHVSFGVEIAGEGMIERFAREIAFVPGSRRQRALDEIIEKIAANPRRKSNVDGLPCEAWSLLEEGARERGRSMRSLALVQGSKRKSLRAVASGTAALSTAGADFEARASSDIGWDTVTGIEPAGVERVFDLSVPGAANFVANDIVVHNSTYARCGIILNVTPLEPEWEGWATLEISNTTPLPAKIYSNEGICQLLFFEGDEVCERSYADKNGKYQNQVDVTLPRL